MADKTGIEWTDATWNPIRGCSRVSEGCRNCYAETVAARFSGAGQPYEGLARRIGGEARWTGEVRLVEHMLNQPLRWKKPRRIFVNSMSDLFHEKVPEEWIDRIFAVMALAPQHTFQVLTKRPERMAAYLNDPEMHEGLKSRLTIIDETGKNRLIWPLPNVWLGVSVENQKTADERIPDLLAIPAAVRFISAEPLLGPVDLSDLTIRVRPGEQPCGLAGLDALTGIHWDAEDTIVGIYGTPDPRVDWVICGGESGPHARPIHPNWARSLREQCADAGVPFFFKQWGEWLSIGQTQDGECDKFYRSNRIAKPEECQETVDEFSGKTCIHLTACLHADGTIFEGSAMFESGAWQQGSGAMQIFKIGKHRAGSLLDGREHKDFPEKANANAVRTEDAA